VNETFDQLLAEVRACTVCALHLPFGPRPVLRGRPSARLLIISQAPGTKAHESGLSFNDRSGDKLRQWLALGWETFYDESCVAIMPVGLCYPGRDARGGDLPPRRECARRWQHAAARGPSGYRADFAGRQLRHLRLPASLATALDDGDRWTLA
jgi:uracil-DNA glycosylase